MIAGQTEHGNTEEIHHNSQNKPLFTKFRSEDWLDKLPTLGSPVGSIY